MTNVLQNVFQNAFTGLSGGGGGGGPEQLADTVNFYAIEGVPAGNQLITDAAFYVVDGVPAAGNDFASEIIFYVVED